MRFADLRTAGRALAGALLPFRSENPIVLALVRGGVPLGVEVARALEAPLDLIVFRSFFLRSDGQRVGAAAVGGRLVLDDELLVPRAEVEQRFVDQGLDELREREIVCRGVRPPLSIEGRTVLLVDNGMRTGGTMRTGIRVVRKLGPARVVAAVPIAGADAVAATAPLADEMVCLESPERLGNAAMGYLRFDVPDDSVIEALLRDADPVRQLS